MVRFTSLVNVETTTTVGTAATWVCFLNVPIDQQVTASKSG
jgi:hypothetical protein